MKTISSLAKEMGVSRQTIYQKIKDNGLTLDDVLLEKQGNKRFLKDQSVEIIKKFIDRQSENALSENNTVSERKETLSYTVQKCEELQRQLTKANEKIDMLEGRLFDAMGKIMQLTSDYKLLATKMISSPEKTIMIESGEDQREEKKTDQREGKKHKKHKKHKK